MMKLTSRLPYTILLVGTLSVAACVDSKGRLEEFENAVVDAGEVIRIDAQPVEELPNINGNFLIGLQVPNVPAPVQLLAELDFLDNGDGTGTVELRVQALSNATRMPEGDILVASDVPVSNAGQFEAQLIGTLPGSANPLTGQDFDVDATLVATITDEDLFCGTLTGMVTRPTQIPLAGGTHAAVRVEAGVVGDQLPDIQVVCPAGE